MLQSRVNLGYLPGEWLNEGGMEDLGKIWSEEFILLPDKERYYHWFKVCEFFLHNVEIPKESPVEKECSWEEGEEGCHKQLWLSVGSIE